MHTHQESVIMLGVLAPTSFATEPVRIDVPNRSYNWASQTTFDGTSCDVTWNATQTFDYKGNPTDSDND